MEYHSEGVDHLFAVTDNGPGVPSDLQKRIFEPFYQAPSSRAKGGKGLGLHLVRTIVEQHGGRVWVESVPGQGSRFWVSLPQTPSTDLRAEQP